MKIVCLSDMHGKLPPVPACDVLVLGGDFCHESIGGTIYQGQWLDNAFRDWLETVEADHVVATPGNHDWIFQRSPHLLPELPVTWLIDAMVEIDGKKFYGTPWSLTYGNWAYMLDKLPLAAKHDKIPECDVLISHSPPYGIGDTIKPGSENLGSQSLMNAIDRVKPKLVVCGHIHGGFGRYEHGDTTIINAALLDEQYKMTHSIQEFEL